MLSPSFCSLNPSIEGAGLGMVMGLVIDTLTPGACLPKTIRDFVGDVGDVSEMILKLQDYVNRLQDEMNKIDPFRKELPLTMILLADVISTVKEELSQFQRSKAKVEPRLEEFIPLKKTTSDDEKNDRLFGGAGAKESEADKMKWMSSVQLWSSDVHNHPITNCNNKRRNEETVSHSTVNLKGCDVNVFPALSLGTPETEIKEKIMHHSSVQQQQQSGRKQRRCWSPQLHRRFVNALHQLGGPQAATPKQIRELMQVEGLTNDEVKSHLQKYRLHTRKLTPTPNSEQPALPSSSRGNSMSAGDSGVDEADDDVYI